MTAPMTLPAFSAYGIELEYMIVDRTSLAVRPLADRLLQAFAGGPAASVAHGPLGWSNELVRHVIEVKNVEPTPALDALAKALQQEVARANVELVALDAQLMPTGMHPSMDPRVETELWTQDASEIYAAYDRIFGCRQHGFANLQSMHINLPFAGDAEFERLHAAVRLVLPFIPALAASSPLADGKLSGFLDYRLEVYRTNAGALSTIAGDIVPDTATGRAQYTEASAAFRSYADANPGDTDLAPQSIYWVGNISFIRQDYAPAARAFAEVIKKYPKSPRAPDAMLKLAQSFMSMGQKSEGCTTLGLIKTKYPSAPPQTLASAASLRKTACSK